MTTETDAVNPSEDALDPRRWWALTVLSVATLMVVLDASIINIALPHAQADLDISDANRQWAVTAYALSFGGLLLLGGRVVDFVGRKRVFLIGLVGFAAASMIAGIATNGATLFAGRALQGVFAVLLAPAALSLIAVTFTDARERAKAFGVYGALQGAGGAVGLIAGGLLTEYTSWRWCLFVNTPSPSPSPWPPCRFSRRAAPRAPAATTSPAHCWSPPAWSPSCGASLTLRKRAGTPQRRGSCSPPAWRCWPPSSWSSSAPPTRCCRCASSWTGTAAARFSPPC
ncbi:MFS transporter [Streptomyces sp. M10(2022)]